MPRDDERRDRGNIRRRQTGEELTAAQGIFDDDLPKLVRFQRHAGKLAASGLIVSPNCDPNRAVLQRKKCLVFDNRSVERFCRHH